MISAEFLTSSKSPKDRRPPGWPAQLARRSREGKDVPGLGQDIRLLTSAATTEGLGLRLFSGALGLALLLAGCAVGPNYQRPSVTAPESFRFTAPIPASTSSLGDLPWWDVFQDERLRELIRIAFTNNYDLRIAITRVEQARSLL